MDKFLESVARYYVGRGSDLRHILVICPNKRSSIFMRKYFKRVAQGPLFMPRINTISWLYGQFTELRVADRLEQLFTLYDAYCEVTAGLGQTPKGFDKFRFWGEMMLDDFNDVDRQMADPGKVFANVASLHEIRTDYLTEEQRQVSIELFGYDPVAGYKEFWNHYKPGKNPGDDPVGAGYRTLSEMMLPVFLCFKEMLAGQGLSTQGGVFRDAVTHIVESAEGTGSVVPGRIAFVGFGVLPKAEQMVFDAFRKAGKADFFWNKPLVLTRDMDTEKGKETVPLSRYIDKLIRKFPPPHDFEATPPHPTPYVDIVSVPANTMQAKVAADILSVLVNKGVINAYRADNTAVVLPDPSLLVPMLYSLPEKITSINVTMGMPARQSPFATLLSAILTMQLTGREDKDGYIYVTQNVAAVIEHASMHLIARNEVTELRMALESAPRYIVPVHYLVEKAPELEFLFRPVDKDSGAAGARRYLTGLVDGLMALIEKNTTAESRARDTHELQILAAFRQAIELVLDMMVKHRAVTPELDTSALTFFRLVEKQLNTMVLNFSGSPLRGVQIMGVIETRTLDFDNVILLSMNEKMFPPKHYIRSLIPMAIRAAYGLTTVEQREMEFSWLFNNLLSRSKRVYLLYNAAAESKGTGGKSRFLFHATHIFTGLDAHQVLISPVGNATAPAPITIKKTKEVLAELDRFKPGGDLNLSATALKDLMHCRLKFYLKDVKRIPEPVPLTKEIQPSAIGTVVHGVLEKFYDLFVLKANNGIMDSSVDIDAMWLQDELAREFDRICYYGRFKGKYDLLPSEATVYINVLLRKILELLNAERDRGPYTFVAAEMTACTTEHKDRVFNWQLNPDLAVRFVYSIDRVDRLDNGRLRFIDYKTGSDKLRGGTFDEMFTGGADAIFQVLTYAHAYSAFTGNTEPINLEITKIYQPTASIGQPLELKAAERGYFTVDTHMAPGVANFHSKLEELVESIFNTKDSFDQTQDVEQCQYCPFTTICRRVTVDKPW